MITVSAVIPTYNRRAHVLRAIESVLAQTIQVDELIVVDDGSTDDSAEAIRSRYGSTVKLFCQRNQGVSAARNRGALESTSNWIAFLDSDDTWLPLKIERQVEALKALGDGFGLCFSDCTYIGHPAKIPSVFVEADFQDRRPFGSFDRPSRYLLGPPSPFRMQSILIRKSLLYDINGFDENLKTMEDLDVLFRLTFKTNFCFVREPLVQIDRNPSRPHGLCEAFSTRDDRKYEDLRRVYSRWLAMPEVAGTDYQRTINTLLRLLCYDSAECKIHAFRVRPALREVVRLRQAGESYWGIISTFLHRKLSKLRRNYRLGDPVVEN